MKPEKSKPKNSAVNNFFSHLMVELSATVMINGLAQAKKLAGERVYNLSAGEPIFDIASFLKKTVNWALRKNLTRYPPVPGIESLRKSASDWINKRYGTSYQSSQTIVTCGGKFGIFLLLQALLNPGDEVLILAPYWVSYPSMVKLFGGKPVIVRTSENNQWKVTPQILKKACTYRAKLLILNNASNPTGALYTKKELADILTLAKKMGIFVLSDEVYSELVYDNNEYISCGYFPQYQDQVAVVQSCSKNFAMTGWRVGFVFGSDLLIQKLIALQSQSITGTSIISQYAALAAFKYSYEIIKSLRKEMQKRRDFFVKTFNKFFKANIPAPASTFYSFVPLTAFKFNQKLDSVQFCKMVLEKTNVAIVPGAPFGKEGYVRFSFGEKIDELEKALIVLAKHYS